jgi:hypothetical protein
MHFADKARDPEVEANNYRRRLSRGNARPIVFLVKPIGGVVDNLAVESVHDALRGDSPKDVLNRLIRDNKDVRTFLMSELIDGVRSTAPLRRRAAALFLYRCGLARELATSLLVDLLREGKGWGRLMAAKSLWDRQRHEPSIPALVALLEDPGQEQTVRRQAARVLGEIGPEARAAVSALRPAARSTVRPLMEAATEPLKKIEK